MRFFILLILWLFPMIAFSQSCGLFDTVPIPAGQQGDIIMPITDYFNNDLGDPGQGLCGIEINFVHNFSENLEISLTSPSGQSIDLIGPNTNDPVAFTFLTKWKISFVPCNETANPDPGYLAQWDNDQPNNFVSGGQYSGSYYPYNGCLEDFNSGAVNGDWIIHFQNQPTYVGAILYIRLIFCDNRGVDCCFADPGLFTDKEVLSCVGDSSLIIQPEITFENNPPDATVYDYTYTIAQDSLLVAYETDINLLNYPPGNYQICGLSYKIEDYPFLPSLDGTLRIDTLYNRLNGFYAPFCGQLSDSCIVVNILPSLPPTDVSYDICAGDTVFIGDSILITGGVHPIHLLSEIGCDSLVNVNINLFEPPLTQLDSTICRGDTVQIGTTKYFNSGFYSDTLATAYLGCDSIIDLSLTVLEPVFTNIDTIICQGNSFTVGDSTYYQAGEYQIPLNTQAGCDSTVLLHLEILHPIAIISPPDTINCYHSTINLSASESSPTNLSYLWKNDENAILGADETVTVNQTGAYYLTIATTVDNVQCVANDTIQVFDNFNTPISDAGITDTISCLNSTVTVGGNNTTTGDSITYHWQALTGNITGLDNTAFSMVDEPGAYKLTTTNIHSGCSSMDTIVIEIDTIAPIVSINHPILLNCQNKRDTIFSTGSSQGAAYSYTWTASECNIPVNNQNYLPVDCQDTFTLTIENTNTGCTQSEQSSVMLDTISPVAMIDQPDTLSCINTSITLNGSNSTPNDLSYLWQGIGITGDPTASNIDVNTEGNYQLIVENTTNFCKDTTLVIVQQDTISPISDAGDDHYITCLESTTILGGGATSSGTEFQYQWTTFDSEITGADDQITLETDTSGTFLLEVINTVNGCRDTTDVQVFLNNTPPFVNAGFPMEFNCGDDQLTLTGNIETLPDIELLSNWTGPCILTPSDELTIDIECAGTYYLEVTNPENACTNIDSVIIGVNPAALFAILPDTTYISCESGVAMIHGENSTQGILTWLHDGSPISLMGNSPAVTEPGVYELTVSNLTETCVDTDQTLVILDCTVETTLSGQPNPLDCETAITSIQTNTEPTSAFYEYQWQGPDVNCIIDGQGTPSIEVICEGDYQLIVTNTNTLVADTLVVNIIKNDITPIANAGLSDTITCLHPIAELDGSLSAQGDSILYFWTDNATGDTISTQLLLPNLTSPGSYLLEVIDTSNQCKTFDFAQVFQNNSDITLAFGTTIIPCLQDSFPLQVFASPISEFYEYEWQGPSFFSPSDSSSILVDSTGLYTLIITNTLSGCTQTTSTTITRQECIPCIDILSPDTLTCMQETVNLELEFCESCEGCIIQWSSADGNILSGATGTTPTINAAGTYEVIVTDTLGFSSSDSIVVIEDTTPPNINISESPSYLTCTIDSLNIGINPNQNEAYHWQIVAGGPILSSPDSSRITIANAGQYELSATNLLNGCLTKDTVFIDYDTLSPIADAGNDRYKTCDVIFLTLDGSNSSQGANISYQWDALEGQNCLQGDTTISPIVLSCSGEFLLTVTDQENGCQDTSSVNVILADDLPVIDNIDNIQLTCDMPIATVQGNTPAATSYTYQWCEIENNTTIPASCQDALEYTIDHPAFYQFEVTDSTTGCQNSVVIEATIDTLKPVILLETQDTIHCNEASIQLSANYEPIDLSVTPIWSNSDGMTIEHPNSLSPTIYNSGTYILSLENTTNGCASEDSIIVIRNEVTPLINAGLDTSLNCFHPQINLSGNLSINTDNYTILWQSLEANTVVNPNILTPTVDAPGNYTLEVTNLDNNCASIDTVFVDLDIAKPSAGISGIDTLQLDCTIEEVPLDASISTAENNHPLSYQWQASNGGFFSGSSMGTSIIAQHEGDYTLVLTDQTNGCMDTLLFSLQANKIHPEINIQTPDLITCLNPQITIDATASSNGANFQNIWLDQNENILQTNNLQLDVTTAGIYQLEIHNTENGCTTTEEQILVTEDKNPPTATIIPPETINCEQMEILLDGSMSIPQNQLDFIWSTDNGHLLDGQNTPLSIANRQGDYQLIVTNQTNGCKDTTSATVIEEASLIEGMNFDIISPDCRNNAQTGSIQLSEVIGGTPPFSIFIDNLSVQEHVTIENLSIGVHSISIEDVNGCTWEDTFTIEQLQELTVELGSDLTIELGDSTTLIAQINRTTLDSIRWTPSELFSQSTGVLEQSIDPNITTAYHVWVMDTLGCTNQSTIIVNVIKPRKYYIPNVFSPNGDGHNDLVQVFGGREVENILFFRIFDRWGNMVFEAEDFAPNNPQYGWDGTLDGKAMNSAVFVYELKIKFIDGWEEFKTGEIILMR